MSRSLGVVKRGLSELLAGVRGLMVPHYQRKYCWQETHCEHLMQDIETVAFGGAATHYFGTITLSSLADGSWYIVDGQQRMTTIGLFLHALSQRLPDSAAQDLLQGCLRTGPLLKLAFEDPTDQKTWRHLLLDRFCDDESINRDMAGNHAFFTARLAQTEPAAWAAALGEGRLLERLLFVQVALPNTLAPQRIFERMNATKLEVSQMDLIKNYLLLCCNGSAEERQVYQNWEETFHDFWWTFKTLTEVHACAGVPEQRLYHTFKDFHAKNRQRFGSVIAFLQQIEDWQRDWNLAQRAFARFTGGNHLPSRYRWLLLKAAMVHPDPGDQPLRDASLARLAEYVLTWMAAERLHINKLHRTSWDADHCWKCLKKIQIQGNTAMAFAAVIDAECQPRSRQAVREGIDAWLGLEDPRPTANAAIVLDHEVATTSTPQSVEQLEEAFWALLEKRRRPNSGDA